MRQWLRKTRVTFPGSSGFVINPSDRVEKHEMRVAFSVEKTISGSPNEFEILIWNLSKEHRNAVGKELDQVQIEAGYVPPEGGGNLGIISSGFIRDVQHERDGADVITTINCGDGDKASRRATISKTYPAGTPLQDVIEGIYDQMRDEGVDRGEWVLPDDARTFKRPYSVCGGCFREMDVLGRGNDFYWSIQNGAMEIVPTDQNLPGEVLISAQTGMVETPTITDKGKKVR